MKCFQNYDVKSSKCEKPLVIKTGICKLNFNNHIAEICRKAGQKLNSQSKFTPTWTSQRGVCCWMCFLSQFSYCLLVWMFPNHSKNKKINRLHEMYLRITYSNKISTFIGLLEKDYSVLIVIDKRNLLFLAIEMFKLKLKRCLVSALWKEMIPENRQNRYKLRNNADFTFSLVKSVHKGLEGLRYLSPKVEKFGWDKTNRIFGRIQC